MVHNPGYRLTLNMRRMWLYNLFICINMVSAQVKEIDLLRPIFFNAPIGSFDSTALEFFEKDSMFRHVSGKGEFAIEDHFTGSRLDYYYDDFHFKKHALFTALDTGRVIFSYSERSNVRNLNTISIELRFTNEEQCKLAYDGISNAFNENSKHNIKDVHWMVEGFGDCSTLLINVRKETYLFSRDIYTITLRGKR
jgi:hypothetical protein